MGERESQGRDSEASQDKVPPPEFLTVRFKLSKVDPKSRKVGVMDRAGGEMMAKLALETSEMVGSLTLEILIRQAVDSGPVTLQGSFSSLEVEAKSTSQLPEG